MVPSSIGSEPTAAAPARRGQLSRGWLALGLCGWQSVLATVPAGPTNAIELGTTPGVSLWSFGATLRGAAGYRDNVVLSDRQAEASAFWQTGLDLLAFRLLESGAECAFSFLADDLRFVSAQKADKEQTVFADARFRRQFPSGWSGGLGVQYFYMDQVLEASAAEVGLGSVVAQLHGLTLRPEVQRALGARTALALEFEATRQYLREPLDDYWITGPKFLLRHHYRTNSEVSLSYELNRWSYDTRVQRDEAGVALPGTSLAFTAQRTELAWQHSWDRRGVVRTTLKAGVELSRDNGSGYYDYRKGYGSAQLKVRWRGWALQTQGGLRLYDYDLETVSDQDPAKRKRFGVMAQVRLERKLSRHLVCFAAFEHEHMVARMAIDRYRVNSVFSGLEWELW